MITNSVEKWRMAKGVSKAHLARRVGVDRSYITKLENGKMQPSGEMMFRFAKYLGQTLEDVFQHAQTENKGRGFGPSDALKATSGERCPSLIRNFPSVPGFGQEQQITPEQQK